MYENGSDQRKWPRINEIFPIGRAIAELDCNPLFQQKSGQSARDSWQNVHKSKHFHVKNVDLCSFFVTLLERAQ